MNDLLVRADFSPSHIYNWQYDNRGNKIRFESNPVNYFVYEYDTRNRNIHTKQFVQDTLYFETLKFYSDTLLIKEIFLKSNGDTASVLNYYYNHENRRDSVISDRTKEYHIYTDMEQSIVKLNEENRIYYESYTLSKNGLIITFEESFYTDENELYKRFYENKTYDEDQNLVRVVMEQYFLTAINSFYYDDIRYTYDSKGNKVRRKILDADGNLVNFTDYIYESDQLVIEQFFNADGNLINYTLVENSCNN